MTQEQLLSCALDIGEQMLVGGAESVNQADFQTGLLKYFAQRGFGFRLVSFCMTFRK